MQRRVNVYVCVCMCVCVSVYVQRERGGTAILCEGPSRDSVPLGAGHPVHPITNTDPLG